ncbi:MAG: PleD family two-component system response regulator [Candidatus Methylomirabilales bacterium]
MDKRPILVIDDDPRSCELVAALLNKVGFEVLSAADGPSGITLARSVHPAVILLDMVLPGIDGITICQRLKQDPVLGDIPVVGITASADLTYTGKAFRAGAEFFLPKPLRSANLSHVVKLAQESTRRKAPARHHRRHPRFPAGVDVRCLVGGGANKTREVVGTTTNVSLGGLLLLLPEKLSPGTVLGLQLGLPERTIPAEGKVIWQNPPALQDERLPHGIQILGFRGDAGLVGYRRYLSQVAPDRAV